MINLVSDAGNPVSISIPLEKGGRRDFSAEAGLPGFTQIIAMIKEFLRRGRRRWKNETSKAPTQPPPLKGIRVLDLTRIIAGPYCAMVLGDLGAEVIKIEQPKIGDESRAWGPPWVGETVSAYFTAINRNKKSLTLNFKKPEGIEIFKKLAAKADVVLENFRPGTLDELGIGYEVLRKINPRLVYCDMTGYGTDGPYRDKPGVDVIVSAIGGLMAITGSAEGEPVKVGVPLTDVLTGIYSFGAISSALLLREKTGLGQRISSNLLAIQLATLINIGANYLVGGIIPRRWGSAHPNIVPYEAHQAKRRVPDLRDHQRTDVEIPLRASGVRRPRKTTSGLPITGSGFKTASRSRRFSTGSFPRSRSMNGSRCSTGRGSPAVR